MTERVVFDRAVAGSDTSCVLEDWGDHNVFMEAGDWRGEPIEVREGNGQRVEGSWRRRVVTGDRW